mgnify:CR=1 FL=1
MKKGEAGLFVTFEESKKKLKEDLKVLGIDLERLERTGRFQLIGGPVSRISFYKERAKAKIRDIVGEIQEVAEELGAERVVIDSLNLFTMLFSNLPEKRMALAELCSALSDLSCTSILTCEVPEDSRGLSWYGFEEFVVDGVIRLVRKSIGNLFIRAIAVPKMRGISHSHFIYAMKIEKDGIKVYPTESLGREFEVL